MSASGNVVKEIAKPFAQNGRWREKTVLAKKNSISKVVNRKLTACAARNNWIVRNLATEKILQVK